MTADDSDSRSSGDSTPPSSRSRRTKESSSKSRQKAQVTRTIQVGNIAPQATREQMHTLFGYVGEIDDLRLFPTVDLGMHITSKICFVKFYESDSVGVALHLTNTVFIDRALIIVPFMDGEIPDEQKALEILTSGTLLPGIADPKLPQHVTSQIEGIHPHQVVVTVDPKIVENNLPLYPSLSPNYDTRKIEEIRRTILVANLDSDLSSEEIIEYFSRAGEVKYFRFCTRDNDPLKYALMEFSEQPSVLGALKLNGTKLGSKYIKVYHSTQAIAKPQTKTNEAAQKEIEEAMSRQAQTILSQGLEATTGKDKRRGSSRSRSRSRSPSRSKGRSRRSRSRSYRRSRSRSNRRSKSRSRRRSTSRHRHSFRSSKSKKSRSRTPRKSRSRSREIRTIVKSKKRSRSRHRKSRSPSLTKRRSRSRSKKRDEKEKIKKVKKAKKEKDRSKERSKDKSEKDSSRDKDKDRNSRSEKRKEKDRGREDKRDHRENGVDVMDVEQD